MKKAFIQLHLSILLAGWTGIFGKLIDLTPGLIVLWRIIIAGSLLWLWGTVTKRIAKTTSRERVGMMLVGALLMLQWTLFYASIKASNVSIGVVTFSTIGFFTAILEPLLTRSRFRAKELLFSLLTVLGVSLIFHFDTQYRLGILFGLSSAAAAAALAVFFKIFRTKFDSITLMSWQLSGGFVTAVLCLPLYLWLMPPQPLVPQGWDILWMLIFATACTLGMYILQIQSLEKISAFTVNLSYNLEPIYSIILAMIIFGEAADLGLSFYAGLGLIALSVALQTTDIVRGEKRLRKIRARQAREANAEASVESPAESPAEAK